MSQMHLYKGPDESAPAAPAQTEDAEEEREPMYAVDWGSIEIERSLWLSLTRRVVRTEFRAGQDRPVYSTLQQDLDELVRQGGLQLLGCPVEEMPRPRTLPEIKQAALEYLADVEAQCSAAAARAYHDVVTGALRPEPIRAAGRSLQQIVDARKTGAA